MNNYTAHVNTILLFMFGAVVMRLSGCVGPLCTCDGIDLWKAIYDKDQEAISLYSAVGGDLDCPSASGDTALIYAVMNEERELYKLLLELGADPDSAGGSETGVVCRAAALEDPTWLQVALEHGADPNAVSAGGKTMREGVAIEFAAYEGFLPNVKLLVEFGANIDARGYNGHTALTMATVKSHFDIVLFLLESGADQTIQSGNRLTFRQYLRGKTSDKLNDTTQRAYCQEVWNRLLSEEAIEDGNASP